MPNTITFLVPRYQPSLFELIDFNYQAFRKWYLKTDKESIVQFDEHLFKESYSSMLKQNDSFTSILKKGQLPTDELVYEFFGSHLEYWHNNKLLIELGSEFSTRTFISSNDLLSEKMDKKSNQIWNYLFTGRSLINDNPFSEIEDDEGISIGFWKTDEVDYFSKKIRDVFGSTEEIRRMGNEASGIQNLLYVFKEIPEKNADLIFWTEQNFNTIY